MSDNVLLLQISCIDYFESFFSNTQKTHLSIREVRFIIKKYEKKVDKFTKYEKTRFVHYLNKHYDLEVKKLCQVIGIPKSTYYYWLARLNRPNKDQKIEEVILSIRNEHPNVGYRPMVELLKQQQIHVNHKRVQRLMKKLGLINLKYRERPIQYNSYIGRVGKISKNRLKNRFNSSIPHQKITCDTTAFIYYDHGEKKRLYLVVFLDLFNREVISFEISQQSIYCSVSKALHRALEVTSDCPYRRTFHSDQGWYYQMYDYWKTLKKQHVFQSMSRKGKFQDNSVIENFFGILKREVYFGCNFQSFDELESVITKWIDYYNRKRLKANLNWKSPIDYRKSYSLSTSFKLHQ